MRATFYNPPSLTMRSQNTPAIQPSLHDSLLKTAGDKFGPKFGSGKGEEFDRYLKSQEEKAIGKAKNPKNPREPQGHFDIKGQWHSSQQGSAVKTEEKESSSLSDLTPSSKSTRNPREPQGHFDTKGQWHKWYDR